MGGVCEGGVYSFIAYLSNLSIDHASLFRHGAPFLLLVETPPTFGRSRYTRYAFPI